MGRRAKFVPTGPSHLARVLASLNAPPKLTLSNLKSLKLSLAFRNDHFGARHFLKEQLPRICYANPNLDIQVDKVRKTAEEAWRPEMELEFVDGQQRTLDMHEKWSSTILKELMEVAGGDAWAQWKLEAAATGQPLVPGEENEDRVVKRPAPTPLPSLKVFRAMAPPTPPAPGTEPSNEKHTLEQAISGEAAPQPEEKKVEAPIPSPRPKTGVAAVLP